MAYRNSSSAYGSVAIFFHWLSALLVVGLFVSGLWMVSLSYYSSWYQIAPYYHKSFGLLLTAVVLIRLVWKALDKAPAPLGTMIEIAASKLVHSALYALLLTLFVSGYLIATGDGRPVSLFGIFQVPSLINSKGIEVSAGNIHFYAAWTLAGLVFLHAAAALKHHFVNKDKVLKRMLGNSPG
ncbi:cytochrome b [Paraburkholderia aspalathi]|nr:cytochrome b [Paraburkholderia aspalathi]